MENNEFKNFRIENRTCYYFDNIIKLEDFDLDNVLIDEKFHENSLIYDISYKTLIVPKPLRIKFDKKDRFLRIYDGTRYLTLFGSGIYDTICNRIRNLISVTSSITYICSHYFAKIKVDSYDSLAIEKLLTLHNFKIIIKSGINNKNHDLYRIFLEKYLYQLAEK